MLVKEKNILIMPIQDSNNSHQKILIAQNKTLIISDIEKEKDTQNISINKDKISSLLFPDEILSIHHLSSLHKILISCVNNKNLYLFDENIIYDKKKLEEFNIEKNALIFQGNKKITSIIDIEESKDKYFLLISDKFGEISMKPIKSDETQENFAKEIKIVSGHCDTIVYFQKSKNDKLLLSSDNFGKIKLYNFPNIFNVISVILYHEDEIKYVNFGGELDKCIIVLNKADNIDIWSTYDFVNQNHFKLDFTENDEKIVDVKMINKNNNIVLLTNKKIILLAIDDNKYIIEKIKEINLKDLIKEENIDKYDSKFFDFEGKVYHLCINHEDNKIIKINSIL
jgi:hypothetical protein